MLDLRPGDLVRCWYGQAEASSDELRRLLEECVTADLVGAKRRPCDDHVRRYWLTEAGYAAAGLAPPIWWPREAEHKERETAG